MKNALLILVVWAAVAWLGASAPAEDWPMYGRDGSRNAVSPEKNPPTDFQVEIHDDAGKVTAQARNVKWHADLGGTAYSFGSPVVSGGLVWFCTNNEGHRDPRFTKDMGCLICFDEQTGKFRWQYLTPRIGVRFVDDSFSSCGSTPLIEGDRLWFINNRWEVVCLDIGPLLKGTGEPREAWKLDMPRELKIAPFSTVMTPSMRCAIGASYKGLIYVITGNGTDPTRTKVPAPDAPALVCIDSKSGKVVWTDNSPGKEILEGQWSSPLVVEIVGKAQVIAPEGDGWIRSFDALTGKLIWKCDANAKNSVNWQTRHPIIAVPVLYQGHIFVATGRDREHGEGKGTLWCIDPTKQGDVSEELDDGPFPDKPGSIPIAKGGPRMGKPNPNSAVVWKFDHLPPPPGGRPVRQDQMGLTMASVAAADGLVVATDSSGFVHCLDAATGKRCWVSDVETLIEGSPLICDGKIYVGDDDGDVVIFALSREPRMLGRRRSFQDPIYCAPILANGVLFVATRSTLYALQSSGTAPPISGDWPQWRGPDRTNIAQDTGLMNTWPVGGPPLLWKATGLGEGVPSVAVAQGRIYTLGYRSGAEFLAALDSAGHRVWETKVGPVVAEQPAMRWLSQRTPTVDGERVYAVTAGGLLICCTTSDGTERWRQDCIKDLGGRANVWGYCDFPLVDGDHLICSPGGKDGAVVALDTSSGKVLWKCAIPGCDRSTYSTLIATQIAGIPQNVQQFDGGTVGVSPTGKLLWQYTNLHMRLGGNVHTAIVLGDEVFCSAGWGAGCALLKLSREAADFQVTEQYRQRDGAGRSMAFDPWLGNSSEIGGHVYTNVGVCLALQSGTRIWHAPFGSRITMAVGDGRLYYRFGDGTVVLADANPEKYVERGRFVPPRSTQEPAWTSPVIAGGRLYLRDQDELLCYDLRQDRTKAFDPPPTRPTETQTPATGAVTLQKPPAERRVNDAIFVPTPHDVVDQMLKLAGVRQNDVVYDLGCGDGRIVVAAAKQYGCHAAGFDTDPECVRMSVDNVRKDNVGGLVNIFQKDIFTVDVSQASVITLYMGREVNLRLVPQLQHLKPGSRIVSHNFDIEGFMPDKVIDFVSHEDDTKHTLYLWTAPLRKKP